MILCVTDNRLRSFGPLDTDSEEFDMESDPTPKHAAAQLLQQDLYQHLDEAEYVAGMHFPWTEDQTEIARRLIPDLTVVIRGMLAQHRITETEECECGVAWPCAHLATIHRLVKKPGSEFVAIITRRNETAD